MTQKIQRSVLFQVLTGVELVKDLKGVKFSFIMIKNKKKLLEEIQSLQKAAEPSGKGKEYENARIELCHKYCDKDDRGRSVMLDDGTFSGVEDNPEFHREITELKKEMSEGYEERSKQVDEYNKMLDEEIAFKFYQVDFEDIPSDITPAQMEMIMPLVREPKK